jgi:hypothetical protein
MIDFGIADICDIKYINSQVAVPTPIDAVYLRGRQNGAVIMWFIFRILEDNIVEILDISARNNDSNLLWFCGRAGLNALDLSGFKNIISKNENLNNILIKLGFQPLQDNSREKYPLGIILTDEYFNSGCSGGNKQ